MSESSQSAAQQRAAKRQAKIKASAGERLSKLTTTARGDEADYIKKDTPFDRVQSSNVPAPDPDDIDLSIASTQVSDPFPGFIPRSDTPDLFSLLNGAGGPDGQLPPDLANNPLFAMMQNMGGGDPSGLLEQQAQQPESSKSLTEKLLPLLHILSMIALVAWTYWTSQSSISWLALPYSRHRVPTDVIGSVIEGLPKPPPLFYAFITVEIVLQSIHIAIAQNTAKPPTMLNSILSVLPPPFGFYIGTAFKYYALAGQVLDDLAVLLVVFGGVIVYHQYF